VIADVLEKPVPKINSLPATEDFEHFEFTLEKYECEQKTPTRACSSRSRSARAASETNVPCQRGRRLPSRHGDRVGRSVWGALYDESTPQTKCLAENPKRRSTVSLVDARKSGTPTEIPSPESVMGPQM